MMNFAPRKQPLKEGRSYPGGLPYAGPPGRGVTRRQGGLFLLLLLLIPLWLFFTSGASFTGAPPPPNPQTRLNSQPLEKPPQVVVKEQPKQAADVPAVAPGSNQAPFVAPVESEDPALLKDEESAHPEPKEASAGNLQGYGGNAGSDREDAALASSHSASKPKDLAADKPQWSERPQFEKALARIINMLPGEMHMRDLLRPVEGTGKERMREMGLRTRAYKSYFEAWEDLHIAIDAEGGSYVRDDVVQYMRSHEHINNIDSPAIIGLEAMDLAQQIRSYESYRFFLAKFGQMLFPWTGPYFSDHMSLHAHFKRGGKGIVLTAGDDQAPYLLTSIPIMRELGCKIPVEVMYLGDSDLSEDFRSELEALDGVVTRDIAQMVNDEGWRLAGWAAKPFAILFSSFREVIFIDADSMFFKNPEVLFDDPGYKKTGALFFRDRLIMPENKKRFLQQILPKPISRQVKQSRFWTGDSGHMQESGVVVVDKWRHFMAMLMVTRMNGPDRDGNKGEGRIGVYDLVYGDKETFWLGWELVGDPEYAFHQGNAGIMGDLEKDTKTSKELEKEEEKKRKEEAEAKKRKEEAEEKKRKEEAEEKKRKEEAEGKKKKEEAEEKKRKEEAAPKEAADKQKQQQQQDPAKAQNKEGEQQKEEPKKQLRKRDDPAMEGQEPIPAAAPQGDNPPQAAPPAAAAAAAQPPTPEVDLTPHTMCSPQLLHLDVDDTPLWFNGWLLDNKFADKHKKKFGSFRHYLIEPNEVREPGAWQLHENNECCLTTDRDKSHSFNERELKLLDRMMAKAREVGAPGA